MQNIKTYYIIIAFLLIILASLISQLNLITMPFETQLLFISSFFFLSNKNKKNDQSSENLKPVKFYNNASALKSKIIADNKKKVEYICE
jgi:hypothetical protein